ncbi:MAG: TraB/GumN family protein [Maricaulaceae bacterium]
MKRHIQAMKTSLMSILRMSLVLALCAGFTACNQGGTVEGKVADARARNDGPAIWYVRDDDSTLYLFGTVHLLSPDINWHRDELRNIFRQSGTVFFEVDTGDAGQLSANVLTQSLGFYKNGRRLSDKLDSYQLKLLEAASHNGNIKLSVLESMTPWLASEFLTIAAAANAGLSPEVSADEALKSRAAQQRKNIIYLDTMEEQILRTAEQDEVTHMALLSDTLEGFNTLGRDLTNIAQAWSVGQTHYLTEKVIMAVQERSPEIYRTLFVDVNKKWAPALTQFMESNGTGFAAVGTGHLLGDDSLQALLREQGYEVGRYYAFKGEAVIAPSPLEGIEY